MSDATAPVLNCLQTDYVLKDQGLSSGQLVAFSDGLRAHMQLHGA